MDLATPRNSQLIDAFRSLAMLHVVFAHALIVYLLAVDAPDLVAGFIASAPFVFNPVWHTYSVDIFFMLSALLIGLPLLSEYRSRGTIGFRAHFLRRATRILPLYYLTLAIYLLVQDPPLEEVLLSLVFMGYVFGDGNTMDIGGWAIEALAQSYVFLPVVALAVVRAPRPGLVLVALILGSVAIRWAYVLAHPELEVPRVYLFDEMIEMPLCDALYHRSWFRLSPFFVGLGLAWLLTLRREALERALDRPRNRRLVLLAGLALFVPTAWIPLHDPASPVHDWVGHGFLVFYLVTSHTLVALGCAAILLALMARPARPGGLPGGRVWQALAQNLYAVFLFHPIFVLLAAVIVFRSTDPAALRGATFWDVCAVFALAVPMTLALAVPLTRYVERPVQSLLRRAFIGEAEASKTGRPGPG